MVGVVPVFASGGGIVDGVVDGEVGQQPVAAQEALATLRTLKAERAGHPAVQHQGLLQVDLAKVSSEVGLLGRAEKARGACQEAPEDLREGDEDIQLLVVGPGA